MNRSFETQLHSWQYRPNDFSFTLKGCKKNTSHETVHFIHGNGLSCLTYTPFLQLFGEHYGLFLHDTQGHGDSQSEGPFIGWDETAKLCIETILTLQADRGACGLIGMGHSFGAIITILMAALKPNLFKGLILLDPVLFPRRYIFTVKLLRSLGLAHRLPMALQAQSRRKTWADRTEALEFFRNRGMFRSWHPAALLAYVKHGIKIDGNGSAVLKCPPSIEADIFSSVPKNLWKAIGRISVPTRVFYGANTYPWIAPSLKKAQSINTNIRSFVVEGLGHCFPLEDPELAFSMVKPALESLSECVPNQRLTR